MPTDRTAAASRLVPALALTVAMPLGLATLAGCAGSGDRMPAEEQPDPAAREPARREPVEIGTGMPMGSPANFHRTGRVIVGGQMTEDELRALRDAGATTVINLRSRAEIEQHAGEQFDEAAAARELGMAYHEIPMGGEDGYDPAQVEALASTLGGTKGGDIVIHCRSGARVRTLLTAYLVTHRGMDRARAETIAVSLGGSPGTKQVDALLGTPAE